MSYIGSNKLGKMYLGSTAIGKAYLGEDLVYDSSGGDTPVLPYDAKIEYLQSTGSQYIDTGIVATTNFECELKGQYIQNNNTYDTILGSYDNNFAVAIGLQSGSSGKLYSQLGTSAPLSQASTLALHTFKSSLKNGTLKIDVDGTSVTTTFEGSLSALSMYMFARHRQDTGVGNYSKAKVYYCKIWNGGNLVFDAIPVRVGQVGYMYDRISGQLLGNGGSGSFTLGNDKS